MKTALKEEGKKMLRAEKGSPNSDKEDAAAGRRKRRTTAIHSADRSKIRDGEYDLGANKSELG